MAGDCPICFCEIVSAVRTPCNHVFCAECFTRALQASQSWNQRPCPYCRQGVTLFNTVDVETGEPLRRPAVASIFGSVYLQGGQPGVAAYHFDSPEECYISYERAPRQWRLDDGSPPPARKAFAAASYDEPTRTFRGEIVWGESTFGGCARWEYEMVFSEAFCIICGGQMRAYSPEGELIKVNRFPENLRYWREVKVDSLWGQVYVQGGKRGLASYHFDSPGDAYVSYDAAPRSWQRADGSPPPGRKAFDDPQYDAASRTFRGTVDWGDNTFGGSRRWEYEIIFSESFNAVAGGTVRSFARDGTETAPIRFGEHLHYERVVEEREDMEVLLMAMHRERQELRGA